MNTNFKLSIILTLAFLAGFTINNFAMSNEPSKIAVVDVQNVVESATIVKNLKKDQEAKAKDLLNYIEKARKDVAATTDVKKKQALEEKYTKEIMTKKEAQEKVYIEKLKEIDNTISAKINEAAKNGNYDIVLNKTSVLYGGSDITEEVKKLVK